ncbi:hypothetical protein PIB30_044247 [Stylosanthes scabra]|uniref:Uncharacterized protein n=1 Tax=Stylosanthes scabra TaxID=79078 RepID=A0ABU6YEM7_9FABA|nr:hypothetical protein [Stylosanthes scabra]
MRRSTSTPDLLLFDPEIERTLRCARQVRRQIEFENNLCSRINDLASENDFAYSSDPDFDLDLSDSGTSIMNDDISKLMLKQLGGARTAMENQPTRYPELNANFELKSGIDNCLEMAKEGIRSERLMNRSQKGKIGNSCGRTDAACLRTCP